MCNLKRKQAKQLVELNKKEYRLTDIENKTSYHWDREERRSNTGIKKIKSEDMRLCEFMCVKL